MGAYTLRLLMRIESQLNTLTQKVDALLAQGGMMAGELDNLKSQVAQTTSVEQSAITLINGIAAQLAAAIAAEDPKALTDLQTQLQASSQALAAAVSANTPAA